MVGHSTHIANPYFDFLASFHVVEQICRYVLDANAYIE